jgi:hypothetical protein
VVVTELAEVGVAYYLGEVVAMSGIPIVGFILLIVGLRQRSHARQLPPPGYPPAGPFPYGPPPSASVDTGYAYQPGPPVPPTPPPYYPDTNPAPRPVTRGTALIVVGSLMLAFGLLGILGRAADLVPQHQDAPPALKVGQCVAQSSLRANNMAPAPQDCDAPDSTLEVASTGGGSAACPDGKLKDSQYAVLFDKSTTLCFLLNLKQGQCYSLSGTPGNPIFTQAGCDGSVQVIQVVKRIDGDYDRSLCPEGTKPVFYLKPARLYCLQPLKN